MGTQKYFFLIFTVFTLNFCRYNLKNCCDDDDFFDNIVSLALFFVVVNWLASINSLFLFKYQFSRQEIHINAIYCSSKSIRILHEAPMEERQIDLTLLGKMEIVIVTVIS